MNSRFRTEAEFVAWLEAHAPAAGGGLRLGIGDDAAVIKGRRGLDFLLKTDMSIEGVHFATPLHPPRSIGHRALARALSDIAAMGGAPRYALISLALSPRTTRAWIAGLYAGIFGMARRHGVAVAGGDTAIVEGGIFIDVAAVGEVKRGAAIRRCGARPGDRIYTSGRLGLAALGLRLLRSPRLTTVARSKWKAEAIRAHLYPQPRCALGRYLQEHRLASSLIDLSDGLSTDLTHLCRSSGVGAQVWADRIAHPLKEAGLTPAADALELALHGGEDYELLFTVPRGKARRVPARFQGVPLPQIGEITESRRILLVGEDGRAVRLRPAGYDHFRR